MTNGELLSMHNEIQGMLLRKSVFAFWHKNQIAGFYEQYDKRIKHLLDNIKQIDEEFFEMQDGKVKTTLITNKPVFKSGKTEAQWREKLEKLKNREILVIT